MTATGEGIWLGIERLVADLRRRGADVSVTEVLDAAEAIAFVDLTHREELRTMLGATLVKQAHHQSTFGELFDRQFPPRLASRWRDDPLDPSRPVEPTIYGRSASGALRSEALDQDLLDSAVDQQQLAEQIVDQHAGVDDGMRTERYHLYRVLRAIDLAAILSAAIDRARRNGEPIDRAQLDARVEALRTIIAAEIRARLADAAGDPAQRPEAGQFADPFDVELARATISELEEIRAAIRPLARRLAAQLRHRRRSGHAGASTSATRSTGR